MESSSLGQCKPMKESSTALLLGTYAEHLSELQTQLNRVEGFNNRMSGAVPQGESGPDAVTPVTTLTRFEEMNTQLRELITKLANEAARLEEIG